VNTLREHPVVVHGTSAGAIVPAGLDRKRLAPPVHCCPRRIYGSSVERTATLHPLWRAQLPRNGRRPERWARGVDTNGERAGDVFMQGLSALVLSRLRLKVEALRRFHRTCRNTSWPSGAISTYPSRAQCQVARREANWGALGPSPPLVSGWWPMADGSGHLVNVGVQVPSAAGEAVGDQDLVVSEHQRRPLIGLARPDCGHPGLGEALEHGKGSRGEVG
jgi:hypothetical protein